MNKLIRIFKNIFLLALIVSMTSCLSETDIIETNWKCYNENCKTDFLDFKTGKFKINKDTIFDDQKPYALIIKKRIRPDQLGLIRIKYVNEDLTAEFISMKYFK